MPKSTARLPHRWQREEVVVVVARLADVVVMDAEAVVRLVVHPVVLLVVAKLLRARAPARRAVTDVAVVRLVVLPVVALQVVRPQQVGAAELLAGHRAVVRLAADVAEQQRWEIGNSPTVCISSLAAIGASQLNSRTTSSCLRLLKAVTRRQTSSQKPRKRFQTSPLLTWSTRTPISTMRVVCARQPRQVRRSSRMSPTRTCTKNGSAIRAR